MNETPSSEGNGERYKALIRAHKVGNVCMDCKPIAGTYPLIVNTEKHNRECHGEA